MSSNKKTGTDTAKRLLAESVIRQIDQKIDGALGELSDDALLQAYCEANGRLMLDECAHYGRYIRRRMKLGREWLPIEQYKVSHRDELRVQVGVFDRCPVVAYYSAGLWWYYAPWSKDDGEPLDFEPTHYMPLAAPPTQETTE